MPSPASLLIWLIGGPILVILLIGLMEFGGYALFDMRIKGALEAATKAATSQTIIAADPLAGGSVTVLDPAAAENVALSTWDENVSQWGPGIWSDFTPQFTLLATQPNTPGGDYDTMYATIQMQFPMSLFNNFLSQYNIQQTVQQQVAESSSSVVQGATNTENAITAAQNQLTQAQNQLAPNLGELKSPLPTP